MAARRAGMAGIVERMVEEGRLADGWTRREAIFMVALTSVDTYEDHKALFVFPIWVYLLEPGPTRRTPVSLS